MEPATLLTLHSLAGDEVAHVDHVAQLAQFARSLAAFEEGFGLLVEDVEAVPRTLETGVAAHDTYVGFHDLIDLLHALRDEHAFLGRDGSRVVPLGDVVIVVVAVKDAQGMLGRRIGIDDGLKQRVGGEAVATMQARA